MRKILLIASFPDSIMHFRGALIEALLAHGLEVHLAAPGLTATSAVSRKLLAKGVKVHDIPLRRAGMNPFSDLRALAAMLRLIHKIRPEYVLAYTIKPVIYGLIAARMARVPHRTALITGLGYAFQGRAGQKRTALRSLVEGLYHFALRGAHKVIFQNPDDQELFRSTGILPTHVPSLFVNGSGIDVSRFSVQPVPESPHFPAHRATAR